MSQSNTKKMVARLEKLSKLKIGEDEFLKVSEDLEKMLDFINQINEVKIDDKDFDGTHDLSNVLRKDEVQPSYSQEEILKNTLDKKDGYFYIKKKSI